MEALYWRGSWNRRGNGKVIKISIFVYYILLCIYGDYNDPNHI